MDSPLLGRCVCRVVCTVPSGHTPPHTPLAHRCFAARSKPSFLRSTSIAPHRTSSLGCCRRALASATASSLPSSAALPSASAAVCRAMETSLSSCAPATAAAATPPAAAASASVPAAASRTRGSASPRHSARQTRAWPSPQRATRARASTAVRRAGPGGAAPRASASSASSTAARTWSFGSSHKRAPRAAAARWSPAEAIRRRASVAPRRTSASCPSMQALTALMMRSFSCSTTSASTSSASRLAELEWLMPAPASLFRATAINACTTDRLCSVDRIVLTSLTEEMADSFPCSTNFNNTPKIVCLTF
mmetsp:Transcript_114493/g.318790  ORF Transcript_114493/g.318790 Transcript_114493/m.318790 type:complete len:307 (-) Transcript_114493:1101-2021(-)